MPSTYGLSITNITLILSILLTVYAHPPWPVEEIERARAALRLDQGHPCSAAVHIKRLGISCESLGEESGLLFAVTLLRCRTPEKWIPGCEILNIEDISKCIKEDKSMEVLNLIWIPYVDISRYCYKQGHYDTVKRMLKVVENGLRKRYPNRSAELPNIVDNPSTSTRPVLFVTYLVIFLGLAAFRKPSVLQLILELVVHAVAFYLIGRIDRPLQVKNVLRATLFLTFICTIPLQIYRRRRATREQVARETEEKRD